MKWLFLVLLFCNVALFGRQYLIVGGERDEIGVPVSDGPALRLLGELPRTSIAPRVPGQPAVREQARCWDVRVNTQSEADQLVQWVLAHGGVVQGQRDVVEERIRYWVLLPPFASRTKAESTIRKLEQHGLGEYYFITEGEHKNAISLGVFSNREGAERRLREVMPLSLGAAIKEVPLELTRQSIRLDWPAEPQKLKKGLQAFSAESQSADCLPETPIASPSMTN